LTHRCTADPLIACWVCECCDWCVGSVSWRPVPVCQHGPLYHSTIYLWRRQRLWRYVWRTELRRLHTAAQYIRLDSHRRRHVALLYIQPVDSNRPVNGHLHRSEIQSLLLFLTNQFNTTIFPSVLWHCFLGDRKGIRPVKNRVVECWCGCLSGARCRLAYDPADATATHCLLL